MCEVKKSLEQRNVFLKIDVAMREEGLSGRFGSR